MKIVIIGGAGRVGVAVASALQWSGVGSDLRLIDINAELAEGEALDLQHGAAGTASQNIQAGDIGAAENADFVIITAGSRRKPDESRLALVDRNVALFRAILTDLRHVPLSKHCTLVVVSNPVDILTWIAVNEFSLPPEQIVGLGTVLDTLRLRSLIGRHCKVDPRQVNALILGEHGDSMAPIYSTATISGVPLSSWPGFSDSQWKDLAEQARHGGVTVLRKKGGAGFAVGVAVQQVIKAIALNERAVLPVSTLQQGYLGMRNVCLSVPTLLGRGEQQHISLSLWPKEERAVQHSAEVLLETLDRIRSTG